MFELNYKSQMEATTPPWINRKNNVLMTLYFINDKLNII